jgi:cupin fold WbuC family metalloprotein
LPRGDSPVKLSDEQIQLIDHLAIADLAHQAENSPRKRAHLLLHAGHDDQVQRLLIVLQPGSYVRPHHHSQQWEVLVALQGRGHLLSFSEAGHLLDRLEMSNSSPVAQIPIGAWHGFFVLEPNTAVMEIKPGPYRPNEFAGWAPSEGAPGVPQFLECLAKGEVGDDFR